MPDNMVAAGMFDRPGMGGMNPKQDMPGMTHSPETSGMEMKSMGHDQGGETPPQQKAMSMKTELPSEQSTAHNDHEMDMSSQNL